MLQPATKLEKTAPALFWGGRSSLDREQTIPPEVFDKRAVEQGKVRFHDVAYIEVTPRDGGTALPRRLSDEQPGDAKKAAQQRGPTGDLTLAVKVIDIFGNDTMTLMPVTVG